jgi:hypothetical protein
MGDWKYVVFNEELIVFFPPITDHSNVSIANWMGIGMKPTSAGFVRFDGKQFNCYGESRSLKLKSDPIDTKLANRMIKK